LLESKLSITKALIKKPKNGGRPPMFMKERNRMVDRVVDDLNSGRENKELVFNRMALRIVVDTIKR